MNSSSHLNDFKEAVVAPFAGAKLITVNPNLWLAAIIPLILGLIWAFFSGLKAMAEIPESGISYYLGQAVAYGFLLAILIVQIVIALISPILAYLSGAVEKKLLGPNYQLASSPSLWATFASAMRLLGFKLLVTLIAYVVARFPFIGVPISSLLVGLVLAIDFLDYPLERRGYSHAAKKIWLQEHIVPVAAFSLTCYLLFMTPVIGGLMFTGCVAGGAILFLHIDKAKNVEHEP